MKQSPISTRGVQALRFLKDRPMTLKAMRRFNQLNIAALFQRGLIEQRGNHIGLTSEGFDSLREYQRSNIPMRLKEGNLAPTIVERIEAKVKSKAKAKAAGR